MKIGHHRALVTLAAVAALGVAASLGGLRAARAQAPRAGFTSLCGALDTTHPAAVAHVMVILFENKAYGSVVGSSAAPYLNNTLIPGCGLATNYHNYSHP